MIGIKLKKHPDGMLFIYFEINFSILKNYKYTITSRHYGS